MKTPLICPDCGKTRVVDLKLARLKELGDSRQSRCASCAGKRGGRGKRKAQDPKENLPAPPEPPSVSCCDEEAKLIGTGLAIGPHVSWTFVCRTGHKVRVRV